MAEFGEKKKLFPNAQGTTAAYTEADLAQIEASIGEDVELIIIPISQPEFDENGNETKMGTYVGAVVKFPSRDVIETWMTLKERYPIKAHEALLEDMLVPGHYDIEVLNDTAVFMGTIGPCNQVAAVKRGMLKKRARLGASVEGKTAISTEKLVS